MVRGRGLGSVFLPAGSWHPCAAVGIYQGLGAARLEDTAYLDDVYVGAPKAVTGVEIQETASVAGYRRVQLTWDVLPDVASNREVTFTSSDESVATVDENGLVTGVTQGEAVITVTTKDGGFTDTCLVSVTGDQPPVKIYGFVHCLSAGRQDGLPAWWLKTHWYTFLTRIQEAQRKSA